MRSILGNIRTAIAAAIRSVRAALRGVWNAAVVTVEAAAEAADAFFGVVASFFGASPPPAAEEEPARLPLPSLDDFDRTVRRSVNWVQAYARCRIGTCGDKPPMPGDDIPREIVSLARAMNPAELRKVAEARPVDLAQEIFEILAKRRPVLGEAASTPLETSGPRPVAELPPGPSFLARLDRSRAQTRMDAFAR